MSKILAIIISVFLILIPSANAQTGSIKTATFAGGCFWCMEPPYDKIEGVISTTSGYTGGNVKNPTYQQVSKGQTGHAEAVEIKYNADKVSYKKLLSVFWQNIDPTVENRQFCDIGNQYRSAIFYHDDQQKQLALDSRKQIEKQLNQKVYTQIIPVKEFYPAEEYHQDYYQKNPLLYKYYRFRCGRDQRLEELGLKIKNY